jgi:hypothetical protein
LALLSGKGHCLGKILQSGESEAQKIFGELRIDVMNMADIQMPFFSENSAPEVENTPETIHNWRVDSIGWS